MAGPGRRSWIALACALAALLASWSPLAAPFGLLTGLGTTLLAWRARRDGGRVAAAALALALLAALASGWVLARTAGLGRPDGQDLPASAPTDLDTARRLDAAAEQGRAARERAARQVAPATPPRTGN